MLQRIYARFALGNNLHWTPIWIKSTTMKVKIKTIYRGNKNSSGGTLRIAIKLIYLRAVQVANSISLMNIETIKCLIITILLEKNVKCKIN